MPMFDLICAACGLERIDTYVAGQTLPICAGCGGATQKLWRSCPALIPDTIIGGLTVENLAPTPITFESRTQHRDYLRAHGITQPVRHVGLQGSDKSPHTSRWI